MKKLVLLVLAAILSLGVAAVAWGQSANFPLGTAFIGEQEFSFYFTKGEDGFYSATNQFFSSNLGSISFDISTNIDPFIIYGLTATNLSPGPVVFGLAIPAFAIAPIASASVTASISGGVTDARGDGVAIAPVVTNNIQTNQTNVASWGVGGPFAAGSGQTQAFTYPAAQFTGAFPGPHTVFGELVAFSLSGNFDVASLTGTCTINIIPLPGAVWLLGSGLLALVGLRGFRKK